MQASPDIVFRAKGLTKVYRNGALEVHALRGIDFQARKGEFVVILGPSGSGKSTFLNIVGGLDAATAGEAWFEEHQLTALDEKGLTQYRRDHVGFVFQFYNLVPGLSERADHFPAQLSGGEQQRVAIARAIAKNPEVLLCDEPTGALDSATGIKVLEALTQVNRAVGATTLVITHNAAIRDIADRVIRFADGRIVEESVNATKKAASEVVW
jgi:putative ABC transport system ATP-binding protein